MCCAVAVSYLGTHLSLHSRIDIDCHVQDVRHYFIDSATCTQNCERTLIWHEILPDHQSYFGGEKCKTSERTDPSGPACEW